MPLAALRALAESYLGWLPAVLVVLGLAAAVALVAMRTRPVRAAILAAALGLLLLAPASWAVQTLGHATNGCEARRAGTLSRRYTSVRAPRGGPTWQ